ncbi:MAG: isocitrate/isopropylmalate dehydrogenase family protein [Tissierellales bacterium]|jgi:isocitrate dehydrogenase (NAD+)|nr:isocitrate/isopropylmalate dehydrogenase family protein [Tissierellales bacterium]
MHRVTLIPGDGIGPEIMKAMMRCVDYVTSDIEWDIREYDPDDLEKIYESLNDTKLGIKGPTTTPIGEGRRSINVHLRQKYDLFANIRPIKTIRSSDRNLDMVIFRENTEGLYLGREEVLEDGTIVSYKIVTEEKSRRIIEAAFEYALLHNRKKVTLVHKANILKKGDGFFLKMGQKIAENYPSIEFEALIVDHMAMELVMRPERFDVIVTMNLYGDILSDLCAGLVGGLGMLPGVNRGNDYTLFEAVHGSAPDIAGKGLANPTAVIRSSVLLLKHIGLEEEAKKIECGLEKIYKEGKKLTPDCGGEASTMEFTEELIYMMRGD